MILDGLRNLLARLAVIRFLNRWLIFFNDLLFSLLSTALVIRLIAYVHGISCPFTVFVEVGLCSLFCSALSFLICRTYKGVIRHSAYIETGRIAIASLIKIIFFIPVAFLVVHLPAKILVSALIIDLILTFSMLTSIRTLLIVSYRYIVNMMASPADCRVLIYSVNKENLPYAVYTIHDKSGMYCVDGFLQYQTMQSELRIAGYPIYAFKEKSDVSSLVVRRNIKAILFLNRSDLRKEAERLVRYCEQLKVRME